MSRGYLDMDLYGPDKERGKRKFLRRVLSRSGRRAPPDLLEEEGNSSGVMDKLTKLTRCMSPNFDESAEDGSDIAESNETPPDSEQSSLNSDFLLFPDFATNPPEEVENSPLGRYIRETSPPRRRSASEKPEYFKSASMENFGDDDWMWPWPEFMPLEKNHSESPGSSPQGSPQSISKSKAGGDEISGVNRKVRFADEDGMPIHRTYTTKRREDEEDPEWMTSLILLLCPAEKKFEFLHISYNMFEQLTVADIISKIPNLATIPALIEQQYTGFCRPKMKGRELDKTVAIQNCGLLRDETLIATLEGKTGKEMKLMASPIISDRNVSKMVKRHTRHGYRVHQLREPERELDLSSLDGASDGSNSAKSDDFDTTRTGFSKVNLDPKVEASKQFKEVIEKTTSKESIESRQGSDSGAPVEDMEPRTGSDGVTTPSKTSKMETNDLKPNETPDADLRSDDESTKRPFNKPKPLKCDSSSSLARTELEGDSYSTASETEEERERGQGQLRHPPDESNNLRRYANAGIFAGLMCAVLKSSGSGG